MSEQEQNIELVKKGYEAFAAGDVETLMSLFDDNIEWVQPGDSAISGTYHGKGELGGYLSRLAEKSPTVTPGRFLADGDTVVVLSETHIGDETAPDVEVYAIRDGKTVRVQVYGDTAMMERIYGKKQLAAGWPLASLSAARGHVTLVGGTGSAVIALGVAGRTVTRGFSA